MNNEPVAWIGKNELQFGFTETMVTNEKESWDDIPLYTHPSKDLTDEEITEIYNKVYKEGHDNQVIALARAILRKANEK